MPDVSPESEPRSRVNASISSKTTTCRADSSPASACSTSASAKRLRMYSSESPTYLDIISGPFTILGSRAPIAFAISRASSVLPQPGGPYRSMPRTGCTPSGRIKAGG
jgi:hypothetical protein